MTIKKEKLEQLIKKYDDQAATNFRNYQETGMTRYETAQRNAEDMADTLRMALNASDDNMAMLNYRYIITEWARKAKRITDPAEADQLLKDIVAVARLHGLIKED